jgi:hypothetical protein
MMMIAAKHCLEQKYWIFSCAMHIRYSDTSSYALATLFSTFVLLINLKVKPSP